MRNGLLVAMFCLLAACASQPGTPAPAKAAAATTNPVSTVQEARKAGYKIVNTEGKTLYCKEQLKTGSHMRKETICLTEQELLAAREASQRNMEQMQKRMPPPHGT